MKKYFIILCLFPVFSFSDVNVCKNIFKEIFKEKPSLTALSKALESSEILNLHLRVYDINARSVESGDTLLHLAIANFKTSYMEPFFDIMFKGGFHINIKETVLEKLESHKVIEKLLLLSASPFIKNNEGYRVIDSYFFQVYIYKSIEFRDENLDIINTHRQKLEEFRDES